MKRVFERQLDLVRTSNRIDQIDHALVVCDRSSIARRFRFLERTDRTRTREFRIRHVPGRSSPIDTGIPPAAFARGGRRLLSARRGVQAHAHKACAGYRPPSARDGRDPVGVETRVRGVLPLTARTRNAVAHGC